MKLLDKLIAKTNELLNLRDTHNPEVAEYQYDIIATFNMIFVILINKIP